MKLSQVFPSKYLKADDLLGREVTVAIANCTMEKLDEDNKLVVYFVGKEKGLVCNKTNADRIAHYYGDDTDMWKNKLVTVYTKKQKAFGEIYNVIHFRGEKSTNDEEMIDVDDVEFGGK